MYFPNAKIIFSKNSFLRFVKTLSILSKESPNTWLRAKKPLKHKLQRSLYVREKIRTPDTLVRSQVLYPAELRTHIFSSVSTNAGDRNRTGTVLLQQDFKSCASASSATPAYNT